MQIHKPASLSLGCRPIQFRGKLGLSISAALYFPFREAAPFSLWTEASMWSFLGKEMSEPIIDEGILKTTAEYLVHAVAHPPQGRATACAVRARVGSREKTLVVHGDRVWNGRQPGPAAPFEAMPLDWSRAYGGSDYPANPIGAGRSRAEPRMMPNTEYARFPLTRFDEVVVPAGFGRLDPMWSTRAQHRGTYDENWLPQHAPGFPPDLQWRHFNLAPPDQWFDQPLVGDETFEFEHLHPSLAKVGGRLPGVRCRAFVRYRGGAHAGKLRDVPLRLTTLWFFPHAERGVMVFQGLADVDEDDGADVSVLMGAVERSDEAKPDQHYLDVLQRREDPQMGVVYALLDSDLMPTGIDCVDPAMQAVEADYQVEGFGADAQYRGAEAKVHQARERVVALGLDPDALGVKMPAREVQPTLSELPAYVEKLLVTAAVNARQAAIGSAQDLIKAREIMEANGIDMAATVVKGPPRFTAAGELRKLAGTLADRPDPMTGAKQLLDAAPKLVEAEVATREAYRASAHLQPPVDPLPADMAAPLRERVVQAIAEGKSLAMVNLTGADLSALDLHGADLNGAHMERANLTGTQLAGAHLAGAVLAHACLDGADFSRAELGGANLGATTMKGAHFEGADLGGAILSNADLDGATFAGANLTGIQLLDTRFGACDWSGVRAPSLNLIKIDLSGLIADAADLSSGNFIECRLDGASFVGARLASANFLKCSAAGTIWRDACLMQAVFTDACDLRGADCSGADMSQANLRGAQLARAKLSGARLDGADLSEADLGEADLDGASLRHALLIRTGAQRAQARQANLMNAILQKADLRGTDLGGSNLFAADLSQTRLDQGTGLQQVLAERVKIHPKRRPIADAAP